MSGPRASLSRRSLSPMRLHFENYGTGQPLVLLHGLFGSLDNWHSISRLLATHFRVLAADLRNHGRSPHSPEMNFGVMAEDLRHLLQSVQPGPAHLLGHSLGGKVAMQFALDYPSCARKLVVVDIAPRAYPQRHQPILAALQALDLAQFSQRNQLEQALARDIPALATRRFLLKNVVRDQHGAFRWRMGLQELSANYPNLTQALASHHSFHGEALFLRGEHSDYLLPADFTAIRSLFPKAEFQTIPRAGHLPHIENPPALMQQVCAFLLRG